MKKPAFGLFLFLLVFSLGLIVLRNLGFLGPIKGPIERIFIPLANATYVVTSFFSDKLSSLLTTFQKDEKIAKLEGERISLLSQLTDEGKIKEENIALKDQLGVGTQLSEASLRQARIIGRSNFLILDKGGEDGISVGDIVVTKNILIGKVSQTSINLSRVTPTTAGLSSIKVQTLKTKAIGVARGDDSGNIVLSNVTLEETLELGDIVVTTGDLDGMGNGFLPNLVIGKIVSIDKNESSLFQKAKIESPVDLKHLTLVYIIPAK